MTKLDEYVRDIVLSQLSPNTTLGEIAKKVGIHPNTLRRRMAKWGILPEGERFCKSLKKGVLEEIKSLAEEGASVEFITYKTGITAPSVYRAFKVLGISTTERKKFRKLQNITTK